MHNLRNLATGNHATLKNLANHNLQFSNPQHAILATRNLATHNFSNPQRIARSPQPANLWPEARNPQICGPQPANLWPEARNPQICGPKPATRSPQFSNPLPRQLHIFCIYLLVVVFFFFISSLVFCFTLSAVDCCASHLVNMLCM